MSNEAILVADLMGRALAAFCIMLWTPVLICWALCLVAWVKGYPDHLTMIEIAERVFDVRTHEGKK